MGNSEREREVHGWQKGMASVDLKKIFLDAFTACWERV
jgi:hypothetical protein